MTDVAGLASTAKNARARISSRIFAERLSEAPSSISAPDFRVFDATNFAMYVFTVLRI